MSTRLVLRLLLTTAALLLTAWTVNWAYLAQADTGCSDVFVGLASCLAPRTPHLLVLIPGAVVAGATWFVTRHLGRKEREES